MQSSTSRLNNIVMLTVIILLTMSGINYIHGRLIFNDKPDVKMQITSIPTFTQTKKWDQLNFRFNIDANLSTLYTWNLKQIYVYVEVQWDSDKNLHSRAILCDWIFKASQHDKWVIKAKDKPLQYLFRDVNHSLRGNSVNVSLNIEYMPTVGIFSKTRLFETVLNIPKDYVQK